ncbi:MAG: OmpH family outer membrane protein, partial [Magnetococcus sp. WYHC-3]
LGGMLLTLVCMLPAVPLCAAGTESGGTKAAAAVGHFAYVDYSYVVSSCNAAVTAQKILTEKKTVIQRELDAINADIERLETELRQKATTMSEKARVDLALRIEDRKNRAREKLAKDQASLDWENTDWSRRIARVIREVVEEFGRENHYLAVFARGQIVYHDPSIDITDKVLLRVNERTRGWF